MHEGLRKVAAELALAHVDLLREQAGRAAGRAVALEVAGSGHAVARLQVREREPEAAKQERSLRLSQGALVRAIAVAVAVLGELALDRGERRLRAGVLGPDGAAQRRQQ